LVTAHGHQPAAEDHSVMSAPSACSCRTVTWSPLRGKKWYLAVVVVVANATDDVIAF
jgi:hypothetical protein